MAGTSSDSVELSVVAGLPYRRRFRVVNGTSLWATLDAFEVRSQIRDGKTTEATLLGSLVPHLTPSIDNLDIVIDLDMSGADTRALPAGYYDIILSDVGTEDERGLRISNGKIKIGSLITAATDVG